MILIQPVFPGQAQRQQHPQQKGRGNKHAVPVDLPPEDGEGHAVDEKFPDAKPGKGDGSASVHGLPSLTSRRRRRDAAFFDSIARTAPRRNKGAGRRAKGAASCKGQRSGKRPHAPLPPDEGAPAHTASPSPPAGQQTHTCAHTHADAGMHTPPLIPPAPAAALFCVWACQSALSLPSIPAHRLPRISRLLFCGTKVAGTASFWEKHPLLPSLRLILRVVSLFFTKLGRPPAPLFFKVLILFFIFGKISYFYPIAL